MPEKLSASSTIPLRDRLNNVEAFAHFQSFLSAKTHLSILYWLFFLIIIAVTFTRVMIHVASNYFSATYVLSTSLKPPDVFPEIAFCPRTIPISGFEDAGFSRDTASRVLDSLMSFSVSDSDSLETQVSTREDYDRNISIQDVLQSAARVHFKKLNVSTHVMAIDVQIGTTKHSSLLTPGGFCHLVTVNKASFTMTTAKARFAWIAVLFGNRDLYMEGNGMDVTVAADASQIFFSTKGLLLPAISSYQTLSVQRAEFNARRCQQKDQNNDLPNYNRLYACLEGLNCTKQCQIFHPTSNQKLETLCSRKEARDCKKRLMLAPKD